MYFYDSRKEREPGSVINIGKSELRKYFVSFFFAKEWVDFIISWRVSNMLSPLVQKKPSIANITTQKMFSRI